MGRHHGQVSFVCGHYNVYSPQKDTTESKKRKVKKYICAPLIINLLVCSYSYQLSYKYLKLHGSTSISTA